MASFVNRVRAIHLKRTGGKVPSGEDTEAFLGSMPADPSLLAASMVRLDAEKTDAFMIGPPRASSILKCCVRFHVIGSVERLSKKEWSNTKSRILFGLGNAIHFWIQNTPDVFEDSRRVGWWQCLACGKTTHFGYRPKKKCKCGANPAAFIYHEHWLKLTGRYSISGHPDLFISFPGYIFRVVEIKSINGRDFERLKAPLAEHEYQVQTYMWACPRDKRMPVVVDDTLGFVLYVSKKHHNKIFPMKMFPVRRSESAIAFIKDVSSQYQLGVRNYPNQLPPPCSDCLNSNFGSYMSKQCVCRKKCMALFEKERRDAD